MPRADKTPTVFTDCGSPTGCTATKAPAGHRVATAIPGFSYTTPPFSFRKSKKTGKVSRTVNKPCAQERKGCPVQLVFQNGQPHLRFCKKAGSGKPGHLVPVSSADEAQRLAADACKCWKRNRKKWGACDVSLGPLGDAGSAQKRKRRKVNQNPNVDTFWDEARADWSRGFVAPKRRKRRGLLGLGFLGL